MALRQAWIIKGRRKVSGIVSKFFAQAIVYPCPANRAMAALAAVHIILAVSHFKSQAKEEDDIPQSDFAKALSVMIP